MENKEVEFEELDFKYKITREKQVKKDKVIKLNREVSEDEKQKKQLHLFEDKEEEEVISIESLKTVSSNINNRWSTVELTGKSVVESIAELNKLKKTRKKEKAYYTKKDKILTRAESRLYDLMNKLLDHRVIILAKVRLADIIHVEGDYKSYDKIFRDIAMKHSDFVILNRQNKCLICVVELDDVTHNNRLTMKSDEFKNKLFYECGIPLFRIGKPIDTVCNEDLRPLENIVLNYFAPNCSVCGRIMEIRESITRHSVGNRFYGCTGFPDKCRNTTKLNYYRE